MTQRVPEPPPCFAQHAQFLRAVARRLVADPGEADDLVQETFVRALGECAPRPASARAWLGCVVQNVFLDRRAAERARVRREQEAARYRCVEVHDPDPFGFDELSQALQALPADYRLALQRRYYAQQSIAQMAAELGVPVATVKTRLHRGLKLLRKDMEVRAGGEHRLQALLAGMLAPAATTPALVVPGLLWVMTMKELALVSVVAVALFVGVRPDRWWSGQPPGSAAAPRATALAAATSFDRGAESVNAAGAEPMPAAVERRAVDDLRTRVAGRVVYAATGQGVPFARATVRDGTDSEPVCADAAGTFTTRLRFAADAEIQAEPAQRQPPAVKALLAPLAAVDGAHAAANFTVRPEVPRAQVTEVLSALGSPEAAAATEPAWQRVASRGGAERLELPVELDPTYFVALTMPAGYGPADFAVVSARDDTFDVGWLRDWTDRRASLQHTEGRLWCRLPLPRGADGGVLLVVYSRDGLWQGRGAVQVLTGVQTEPVVVSLRSCGVVHGTVRDHTGAPRAATNVELVRTDASSVQTLSARTDAEGRFRILHAPPGPARLDVLGEQVEPWRQAIDVPDGRSLQQDVVLTARAIGGRIAGTVRTGSGAAFEASSVILTSRHDSSIWRTANLRWQVVDGRQCAAFEFEQVPLVECDVTLHTFAPCATGVQRHRVTAPHDALRFEIEDRLAMVRVPFRIVTANGAVATGPSTLLLVGDEGWQVSVVAEGRTAEVALPDGQAFHWRLLAGHLRSRSGHAVVQAGTEVTIAGEPGYSARLNCTDIANYYAARGVAVFADGVPVGSTNDDGELCLDLPAPPRSLQLDTRQWRLYDDGAHRSDLDAATGVVRPGSPGAQIHFYVQRVF